MKRIVVALDLPSAPAALDLASRLDPALCRVKVGKELFTAAGPALLEGLRTQGHEIFLDLKFHDIPNTVAGACRAAAGLGVWMVNVHASGGRRMIAAAREALAGSGTLLTAVTVLTSMGPADLAEIGLAGTPEEAVERLAGLAQAAGADGVVCSAREAQRLRSRFGADFLLVTPGIRAADAPPDDQTRTMTAAEAIAAGAHHLVIGRPITAAADPAAALVRFSTEISGVVSA